jgi:Cof subfamily protein (haloacid dehalogenase superfamily)
MESESLVPGFPRLVATDLDGTLLRSDGTVSARTRRALRSVVAAGAQLVVVTARPPRYVDRLADELDLTGVAICANGAILYDLASRAWRVTSPVPLPAARRLVAALTATAPVGFAVETGELVVYEPGFARQSTDRRRPAVDLTELWALGRPIVKLLAWSAELAAEELVEAARTVAGDEVECTFSGGSGLIEVSAAGVSKVVALGELCARLGIAAERVLAFGDMPNDLAMLRWAGTGYPVANAHPSVLAALPRRTASNNDDGVAQVLEALSTSS